MKNILPALMMLFALNIVAQSTHTINFETPGIGSDWNWIMAENADNPPLEFVANPVTGGINTSLTVAKFIARVNGNPWALCFTDDDGEFSFDAANSIVKIMVCKSVISNVGFKVEGDGPTTELVVANTLVNQWEELTFNFTAVEGQTYSRLVIIPDFDFTPRSQENTIYFDNIQVPNGVPFGSTPEPTTIPPVPSHVASNVISIYSDAYANLPGTNYNPFWGQSTSVTVNYIAAGNNTLRYENLNYQGTEYTNQDVSEFEFLHVDFWTANSTDLGIYLISPGPSEIEYVFTITAEEWVSVDIPLSAFVPPVDLTDVFQFKVSGNGDVFFDNLYFWKTAGAGNLTFNPPHGAINVAIDVNPVLSFSLPVEMADESPIIDSDIISIITLKETDAGGADVPFIGSINPGEDIITIIPMAELSNNQTYFLSLNHEIIKYQGGDLIPGQSITFTTIQSTQLDIYDNFDDPGTLTWGYWDNGAGGVLDVFVNNPAPLSPFNSTPIVAKYTKEAGSNAFSHAFAILGGKLDLSINHLFQMFVYSENAGSVFALKLQNNDLAEPWTTEVFVEYTIQNSQVWELATFDFSSYSTRNDLDKIVLMIDPGQMGLGVHYFDEIYGPSFTPPAESPIVVDAYTTDDGSAIEVTFDKEMESEPLNGGNFNVYTNGNLNPVTSTYRKTGDNTIIVLNLASPVAAGNEIFLSYLMSGTITSLDHGVLEAFSDYPVTNTIMLRLSLNVFLEGPFNGVDMTTILNPAYIPHSQPYSGSPWNYNGTENVSSIPTPDIVDWVLIELRDATNAFLATSETTIAQQAAFLLKDGSVVGLDGSINPLLFENGPQHKLYVAVRHRNHIGVLSANEVIKVNGIYTYNFISGASQAYGNTQKEVGNGIWAMVAGNGVADIQIDELDKTNGWEIQVGGLGFQQGDYNLDAQVDNKDKNDFWLPNFGLSGSEYQLIWYDEFDVDGPPAADKWNYDIGTGYGGWGNGELQYYTNLPQNVRVENGKLLITARNESYAGSNYTSGRIKTENKFSFQYGRVDVRSKLPGGEGIWPANWMLGSNFSTVGWPACGEIDIMEYRGVEPDIIHCAIHTPSSYGGTINHTTTNVANVENEFHVYSIVWDETAIIFLIDNIQVYQYQPTVYNSSTWPFDAPAFILLNVAVGGSFGGNVNNSIFPQTMEVDYVRVYQKN